MGSTIDPERILLLFPTELELRGWSLQDKQEIVAQATAGDEVATTGGNDSGAALSEGAFGAAAGLLSNVPVFTQAEADQLALARFNRSVLELISGDGVCNGRPDLRPGQVMKIDGIGTRFSGQYYVSATSHCYTPRQAYQTHFVVRRNAA